MSAALDKRKEAEPAPMLVPQEDSEGPRRSMRIMSQIDVGKLQTELNQCRTELLAKSQGKSQHDVNIALIMC